MLRTDFDKYLEDNIIELGDNKVMMLKTLNLKLN